jgi:ELWxxDGT repeat protein
VNRSLGHPLLLALLLALVVPPEVSTHRATADLPVPYLIQGVAATNLTDIDGTLYFSGMTSDFGFEPWKSDGTLAGTHQIKDIHDQNENYGYSSDPDGFTRIAGGIVLFTALTGDAPSGVPTYGEGEELWRTDGTLAGTWLVKDIRPGPESAFSTSRDRLGTLNGVAYFAANNGLDGYELWRSDGTSAGTVMLKDIRPGAHSSFPGFFTEYNGLLYFQADDGTGTELWRTDGTSGGTQMVRNINPGGSSNPREMTVAGGWLYFSATDGVTGAELWKTDGTEAGTSLVVDLRDGSAINPAPSALTELNGQVAFRAVYTFQGITCGPELFVSDGTAAGTTLIDIEPGCGRSDLSGLVNANGRLFFAASDGSAGGAQAGLELWSSDGTAAGTLLVRDINPGLPSSNPQFLTPANGFVYFSAATALDGIELWRTDGTPAGTQLVGDLADGPASSQPQEITVSGNTLFFRFGQNAGAYPVWSLFAMELTVDEPLPPIITPVITGTLGDNGWYVSNVSVTWTIDDRGFPINSTTGCGPQSVLTDTTGIQMTCTATNAGGTAAEQVTIKRDTTPPEAHPTPVPPTPASGWFGSNVIVTWVGSDATSGIASCTSPVTITTEGQNQSSGPGTCTDNAGLVSTPMQLTGINIDKTPPVPTVTPSSENNEAGWYNVDVTATWSGEDALSGIAGCTPPQTIATEGEGQSTDFGGCVDFAGNASIGIRIVNINIDKTAPSAVIVQPRGVLTKGDLVLVSFSCSDGLSGVQSCAGTQPNGTLVDTSKPTKKGMFTVVVTDLAGNQTKETVSYEVVPSKGGGRGGGGGGGGSGD